MPGEAEVEVEELLWSARQAAKACGIGERTLWRLAACGEFPPPIRIGGRTLWRAESVREWIATKEKAAWNKQAVLRKSP